MSQFAETKGAFQLPDLASGSIADALLARTILSQVLINGVVSMAQYNGPKSAHEAINLWSAHESGHVIIGTIAGYKFENVRLEFNPTNGGLIGLSTSFGEEEKKHATARMFVLTTMGGIGAELSTFNGEIPEWSHNGWEEDIKIVKVFQLTRAELEAMFTFAQTIVGEHQDLHTALRKHIYERVMLRQQIVLSPADLQKFLEQHPITPISEERFHTILPKLERPLKSYAAEPDKV
jgi:hypothetical protein